MWSGMLHTGWMVISSSVLPFISKLLMRFRIYLTEFERIQIAICCHLVQFVYLQLSPPITLLPPSLPPPLLLLLRLIIKLNKRSPAEPAETGDTVTKFPPPSLRSAPGRKCLHNFCLLWNYNHYLGNFSQQIHQNTLDYSHSMNEWVNP